MINPKKKIKAEMLENLNENLSFDLSQLESNNKRGFSKYRVKKIIRNTVIGTLCSCILIIVIVPILLMLRINTNPQMVSKKYNQSQLNIVENNTFKKLNEITYPNKAKRQVDVSEDYKEAVIDFAYNIYNKSKKANENQIISPLSLYALLDIISLGTTSSELIGKFNTLLGVNSSVRDENFSKMYENNYYISDEGTIQMYNGLFLSNEYEYNQDHIDDLNNKYCEAYSMDFNNYNDVSKMLKWVNEKVQENNFIQEQDLDLNSQDKKAMFYFSTMFFDNKWREMYSNKLTLRDNFFKSRENYKQVDYMSHNYYGEVYDYDTYYTFYDYYKNGSKIKYYLSKSLDDNIFNLIDFSSSGFLKDDEDKRVFNYSGYNPIIELTVPKFTYENFTDFSTILVDLGLEKLFSRDYNSLDRVFKNYSDTNFYAQWIKQKNKVTFSEDGTSVRTVSFGGFGATNSAPMETLKAKINRPFIYVIYDSNDLPLYIGNVIDPSQN